MVIKLTCRINNLKINIFFSLKIIEEAIKNIGECLAPVSP